MDESQANDIRIFDANSRIGRCRYLVYPVLIALMVLPAAVVAGLLMLVSGWLAGVFIALLYIFVLVMQVVFVIRRLHDLNFRGWWALLYPISLVIGVIAGLMQFRGPIFSIYLLTCLIDFIFALALLFMPGSQDDNRFGPPPPPNSTGIIVGAWIVGLVFPVSIIAIVFAVGIPAYQDYVARSQTSEGIRLAGGAEVGVSQYFKRNNHWPTDLPAIYTTAGQNPAGQYVATVTASASADGSAYGIVATMKNDGVNSMIAGTTLEIWSNDGGETWHCGPGGNNPVPDRYLPASCRETDAP